MHFALADLNAYDFGLEFGCEGIAPGRFQFGNICANCFFAINSNDKLVSADATEHCERRLVVFSDLLHGAGIGRIEADNDS
jgi:hypothetical protein